MTIMKYKKAIGAFARIIPIDFKVSIRFRSKSKAMQRTITMILLTTTEIIV